MDSMTDTGAERGVNSMATYRQGVRAAADLAEWLAAQGEINDLDCTPPKALQIFAEVLRETFLDKQQGDDGARL
jgi:hypothetical protein